MTTKQSDKDVFVCQGPAFDMLKAYVEAHDLLISDQQKIQKEFAAKALKQREVHEANMHDLWVKMALLAGLDPSLTWLNPAYQVETRYIKEGFGAIVYEKVPDHPLAAIMGEKKEEEVGVIETPDKKDMH